MGEVSDAFGTTFRDYETDGVPASGPHNVTKAEAQALGGVIETEISTIAGAAVAAAETAAAEAEIYAAAAQALLDGSLFSSTTDGIAGTASGDFFFVVSGGALSLYKNVAGVATSQGYQPLNRAEFTEWVAVAGRESGPGAGTSAGGVGTYSFATPIARTGLLRVRVYGGTSGGTIKVRRFTRSGNTYTRTGSDINIAVTAGTLAVVETGVTVNAGEFLGYYSPADVVAFSLATADSGGWVSGAGDVTNFTDATITQNSVLHIGFDVLEMAGPAALALLEERLVLVEDAGYVVVAGAARPLNAGDGSPIAAATYVFDHPIEKGGRLRVRVFGDALSGSFLVRRYTKDGTTYTATGDTVVVPVTAGEETVFDADYIVTAGDYLGFVVPAAGLIAFTADSPGWSGGWVSHSAAYNPASFSDASVAAGSFEISFSVPAERGDLQSAKVIACFGDSVTEFGDWPERIARRLGMPTLELGFGGTQLSSYYPGGSIYQEMSMAEISASIAADDFTDLLADAATEGDPDRIRAAELIAATDWSQVDYAILFYGQNDFAAGVPLGTAADATGATFNGAMNFLIENLQTTHPQLKLLFVTPYFRSRLLPGDGLDSDNNPNGNGDYLIEFVDAIIERANAHHIPVLDMYRNSGINAFNEGYFLDDGLHPTAIIGYQLIADKIAAAFSATY